MSDAIREARLAEHELHLTERAHATYREQCLEAAVKLAEKGEMEKSYQKLLMVVAIDGVRQKLRSYTDDATIERATAKAPQSD